MAKKPSHASGHFKVILKDHWRWILLCYIVTDDLIGDFVMKISLFFNDELTDGIVVMTTFLTVM
jgi:hypothetical protein